MHFVDEAVVLLVSGNGGPGCVSFAREKLKKRAGPDGGHGGCGGSVYLKASSNIRNLSFFKRKSTFRAQNGRPGMSRRKKGRKGQDLIILVPLGTEVYDGTMMLYDLIRDGETYEILKGGRGGVGNSSLATSIDQSPRYTIPHCKGKEVLCTLKLKFLAHIGLIGFPNSGKSTLFNKISGSSSLVANYPFSTIKPHVNSFYNGIYQYCFIADLPGIIHDSHKGKGLGIRFLAHAERCKMILYILDISSHPLNCLISLHHEVKMYNISLYRKESIIVMTKSDLISQKRQKSILQNIREYAPKTNIFIVHKDNSDVINDIKKLCINKIYEKT